MSILRLVFILLKQKKMFISLNWFSWLQIFKFAYLKPKEDQRCIFAVGTCVCLHECHMVCSHVIAQQCVIFKLDIRNDARAHN